MTRWLFLLLTMSSLCDGQVIVREHASGATLASPYLVPDMALNDFETVALDVVNTGASAVTVQSATATGLYFSLCCDSGFVLQPGEAHALTLRFAPTATGSFSGSIQIDALTIFVFARSIAGATLLVQTAVGQLQAHSGTPLIVTESVPFPGHFSCVLENPSTGPITVQSLAASAGWAIANAPPLPLTLAAGQQAPFTLVSRNGASPDTISGAVSVDQISYAIEAHPPMPGIHISIPSGPLQSGQQVPLSITFDKPPAAVLAGSITMTLATTGPIELTDPAILFPSTGSGTAGFASVVGQTAASFNGSSSLTLQTGTTQGTLHLIATWGFSEDQLDIPLAPAPVAIETVAATRDASSVSVAVTGYDNTRTAGRLSFSFFDAAGAFIGDPVTADFTVAFYDYFFQTAYNAGGMFKMTARFPVTGGTGTIHAVEVDLMNSAGNAQSEKTQIQ